MPVWLNCMVKQQDLQKEKAAVCTSLAKNIIFYGGHGIVGGQIGVGAGIAFAEAI